MTDLWRAGRDYIHFGVDRLVLGRFIAKEEHHTGKDTQAKEDEGDKGEG
jgi:hypothetical protein